MDQISPITPTSHSHRILSLDLLRGIALLGILLMNIHAFAHPGAAYLNPTQGAGLEGYNFHLWNFNWLFADMKFLTIFSMLFGAGAMLFNDRLKQKGMKQGRWHYRRMFFLFLFGMIHAYFIWAGDILVAYSLCGCLVFLFRNAKKSTLLIAGGMFYSFPVIVAILMFFGLSRSELMEFFGSFNPSQEEIDAQIKVAMGGYGGQLAERAKGAGAMQTLVFFAETFWHVTGNMLFGAFLFRSGILSAEKSKKFYRKMGLGCLAVGVGMSAIGLYLAHGHLWEATYVMTIGRKSNYVAALVTALGYIGLVMLWSKSDLLQGVKQVLRSVGRMAFTNYILMSVLAYFVFYGMGFGLYAKLDRLELLGVVVGIWVIILVISPLILGKWRQGPLEGIWRKLTYGRRKVPMPRESNAP